MEAEVFTLFEQTKDLEVLGGRLSGDPEVLHEIQDACSFGIASEHIKLILESAPDVFPEDWERPEELAQLDEAQRQVCQDIAARALMSTTGPQIQEVIRLGIKFRARYS